MGTSTSASSQAELGLLLNESVAHAQNRARIAFDSQTEACRNKFVLFGAGNIGRRVLARLREDGVEPLAFADNQNEKWGTMIEGLPVLPPAEAADRHGREAAFIVTIYNREHSFAETRLQLESLGCAKVVSVIPFRWKHPASFLPYYRDDLPHKVLLQAEAVRDAFHLWTDETSRREYVAQVRWRLQGDSGVLSRPVSGEQYFPEGLFHLNRAEVFVDVGAYDGDTIRAFRSIQGDAFERIIALEPDPENFRKLKAYVEAQPSEFQRRIEFYPFAAGREAGYLRFAGGEGEGSALREAGSHEVQSIRLDDLLTPWRPSYIKMDVEGAELDAIAGCERVLSEKQPVVAACAYHAQDHLWKVPLAVRRRNPRYAFFLRPHMEECWDTVCYAVPTHRLARSAL